MAKYLDQTGLQYLWKKIKLSFAAIDHLHDDRYSLSGHNHDGRYIDSANDTAVTSNHVAMWGANGHTLVDSGFIIQQSVPTSGVAGFISVSDQEKLDNIEAGAEVNKINSVSGSGYVSASTSNSAVTVSLDSSKIEDSGSTTGHDKLATKGYVDGLAAQATITGLTSEENILSINNQELSTTLQLGYNASAKTLSLIGINGAVIDSIDVTDFVKDGMLDYAGVHTRLTIESAVTWTPTLPAGVEEPEGTTDGTYIVLRWNTDAEKTTTFLNVTHLIDIYTAGNGLELVGNQFRVKLAQTQGNVTLSFDGQGGLKAEVDLSGKADKVTGATAGNFAGLDANGNLTDSGNKASDFAASAHTHEISEVSDLTNALDGKVDKVAGKGLSTNDLTDELKEQYDEAYASAHTHANKDVLDTITSGNVAQWESAITDIKINGSSTDVSISGNTANLAIAELSSSDIDTAISNAETELTGA